jgi:hypothetical protein
VRRVSTSSELWSFPEGAVGHDESVKGYDVEASDGHVGTVSWADYAPGESYLVVSYRHHLKEAHHVVPAGAITNVDHAARRVTLNVSADEVRSTPQHDDPETAVGALRRHYVDGRLTAAEFAERVEAALVARTRSELNAPLADLPRWAQLEELGLPAARAAAGMLRRAFVLAVAVGAWLLLSAVLLVAFVVALVAAGATTATLIAFPLAWVVLTVVLFRSAAGGRRRPHRF